MSRLLTTALFTFLGNAYLVVATLVLGVPALIVPWIPPRGDHFYRLARLWCRGLLHASGVRLDVRFEEPLPAAGGYVVMANHQSLFDVPALIATLPGQTRFLAKKRLFKIPFFGWGIKLGGFIPVDRRDRSAGRASFKAAAACLESGRSVVLFPEETRSLDGRLLPFKRGGFLMGLKTGRPVVPVGIRGTLGVRRRGSLINRPARVEIRYGRPVDPAAYGLERRAELVAEVRERIAALAGCRA